ncbi:transposase [Paracidovorax wautersii]
MFFGGLYRLRTGSQWRLLQPDFPKWQNVHGYWRK